MSCAHCGALEQRGRFCVGCGTVLPPRLPTPRRITRAASPHLTDDMTQPVLRLRHAAPRPGAPVRDVQEIPA